MRHVDDPQLQQRFMEVKLERKQILADYIRRTLGIEVDVHLSLIHIWSSIEC